MIQRVRLTGEPPPAPRSARREIAAPPDVTWWTVLTHFHQLQQELNAMEARLARAATTDEIAALKEEFRTEIRKITRAQDRVRDSVRAALVIIPPSVVVTLWAAGLISLERLLGWLL